MTYSNTQNQQRERASYLDAGLLWRIQLGVCIVLMMLSTAAWSLQASLVSVAADGSNGGNQHSSYPIISGNGRYILFISAASNLAPNDTNGASDVFVRDLHTNTTTLVSINEAGTASANGSSLWPSISDDGRYIAFVSHATNLTALDQSNIADIFVRDMMTGTTSLVSVNTAHNGGSNSTCLNTAISGDGRTIAFESYGTNLVSNSDTNGTSDTYARDLDTGVTRLLTVTTTGIAAGEESRTEPTLSFDGNMVVFSSSANTLVSNDRNGGYKDIFAYNMTTGTKTLVTVNRFGTGSAIGQSEQGQVSGNGRRVAFTSCAEDLAANDNNGRCDVFARDLQSNTTALVSVNSTGTAGGNGSAGFKSGRAISNDGNVIAFESNGTDYVSTPDSNGAVDVFVRNLASGTTQLASINYAGTAAAAGYSALNVTALSGDGNSVIFDSTASNLVTNDTSAAYDIFVHNLQLRNTTLASVTPDGAHSANASCYSGAISHDGMVVAFGTAASNLSLIDTNQLEDVYATNLANAAQFHISGQIRTSTMAPIAGVSVQLNSTSSPIGNPVLTATNGYYDIPDVAPGYYTITVSKPGFSFSPTSQSLRVTSANRAANFTGLFINPTYALTGRISDSRGSAILGVTVVLSPAPAGVAASVQTNSAGYYTFTRVPDGNYTITPGKNSYWFTPSNRNVTVNGANLSGQNFIGLTGYTVIGRIAQSNGVAIAGVTVMLSNGLVATTNSAGYFTFYGVPNGNHFITPSKSGYTFTPVKKAITVQDANLSGQNFTGAAG